MKNKYLISKETIDRVLEVLRQNMFSGDYNNDEVIEAIDLLEQEIKENEQ